MGEVAPACFTRRAAAAVDEPIAEREGNAVVTAAM
jgi:hypothetical protein